MSHFFSRGVAVAVIVLLAVAPSPARQAGATPPVRIGSYSIAPYGTIKTLRKPNGDLDFFLTGQNNRPMLAKSPDYDITAPHMEVSLTGAKRKPTRFIATGSVKVVSRNPQSGQKTVITCQEIRYAATVAPGDRGVMRLLGNVHSETIDANAPAPIITNGDTGTARFLPDGTLDITLEASGNNGTVSGQVYEPKPKGSKP